MDTLERAWRRQRVALVIGALYGLSAFSFLRRGARDNAPLWAASLILFLAVLSAFDRFLLRPALDRFFGLGGDIIGIRVEDSIVINRPLEEVFAFAVRPETMPSWRKGLKEAKRLDDGPLGVGTKVRYLRYLAGRWFESVSEITAYEPNRTYRSRDETGEPFAVEGGITLEPHDGSTRIRFSYQVRPGRLLGMVPALVGAVFRREIRNDFRRLKTLLESQEM